MHGDVGEDRIEVGEDVVQGQNDELVPARKDVPEEMVSVDGFGLVDDDALLDDAASDGPLVNPVHLGGILREVVEVGVEEGGERHGRPPPRESSHAEAALMRTLHIS